MEDLNLNPEYIAEVRKLIGIWIKEFRKEKNLTIEEVADLVGVKKSTISKVENGSWLSLEMLIKLSVKLDFYLFLLEKNSNDELAVAMRKRWKRAHDEN